MEVIGTYRRYAPTIKTGALGFALIGLAACSQGDSTSATATPAPGGSAALNGPLVFVNNTGDKTLQTVALRGNSNNESLKVGPNGEPNPIPATELENVALGDMQVTTGEWVFVNLTDAGKVAAIDPLTGAIPVHEVNLQAGTRPVHIFRDANDSEVVWVMNDGDNTERTTTPGDDLINCNNPARVGGAVVGGSVTAIHNSHLGPGAKPPTVLGTTCILADGHKVAAFSTSPKRVFVSSEIAGEIAVIDDQEGSGTYRQMIRRIDLCNQDKEDKLLTPATPATCNTEDTIGATPFTPNNSAPHGIRWSKVTQKIYSLQEGYHEIAEINPTTFEIEKKFDLSTTPYTGYGISPDGRYLLLRGETTSPEQAVKLGVIDLKVTPPAVPTVKDLDLPVLNGGTNGSFQTGSSSFKFSPNGKHLYFLLGNSNSATVTKKDRLFAFDTSTLSAATPALTLLPNGEISLLPTGRHSMDVYAEGAGEAKYIVVSNRGPAGSVDIINATDNTIKDTVRVGTNPGAVLVYRAGAAQAGNQATN